MLPVGFSATRARCSATRQRAGLWPRGSGDPRRRRLQRPRGQALFGSRPAGPTIAVAYALLRHRDPSLPTARGTVLVNPGGPGSDVIANAARWNELLADLLDDHDDRGGDLDHAHPPVAG